MLKSNYEIKKSIVRCEKDNINQNNSLKQNKETTVV